MLVGKCLNGRLDTRARWHVWQRKKQSDSWGESCLFLFSRISPCKRIAAKQTRYTFSCSTSADQKSNLLRSMKELQKTKLTPLHSATRKNNPLSHQHTYLEYILQWGDYTSYVKFVRTTNVLIWYCTAGCLKINQICTFYISSGINVSIISLHQCLFIIFPSSTIPLFYQSCLFTSTVLLFMLKHNSLIIQYNIYKTLSSISS